MRTPFYCPVEKKIKFGFNDDRINFSVPFDHFKVFDVVNHTVVLMILRYFF